MKVLEPGPGWSLEVRCTGSGNGGGGCEAKLLVEERDLFRTSHTDYTGDTDHYNTFQCCACLVLTDIPSSQLPSRITRNLKPRYDTSDQVSR